MNRLLPLLALLARCSLAGGQDTDAARKDLDQMQGTWIMAELEVNGKQVQAPRIEGTTLTVKGEVYSVKVKDKTTPMKLKLNVAKDPREMDMIGVEGASEGKVHKGIYKLDGDKLVIVRGLTAEQERPREFGTWPDTNVFMVTWKRTGK